jgi:hypothetical protein
MDGHPFGVSRRVTYLWVSSPRTLDDPWARQMEGQVAGLKKRIPILKRLIADCDRLAADPDQGVRNEEDRVKIHDPAHYDPTAQLNITTGLRTGCHIPRRS